jgi:hypothetical protein
MFNTYFYTLLAELSVNGILISWTTIFILKVPDILSSQSEQPCMCNTQKFPLY